MGNKHVPFVAISLIFLVLFVIPPPLILLLNYLADASSFAISMEDLEQFFKHLLRSFMVVTRITLPLFCCVFFYYERCNNSIVLYL